MNRERNERKKRKFSVKRHNKSRYAAVSGGGGAPGPASGIGINVLLIYMKINYELEGVDGGFIQLEVI